LPLLKLRQLKPEEEGIYYKKIKALGERQVLLSFILVSLRLCASA